MTKEPLTDAEINLAIAELVYLEKDYPELVLGDDMGTFRDEHGFLRWFEYNYYNNWSDLMPLVDKYGIGFEKVCFGEDTPYFVARGALAMVGNKNLQHALADCLLKVLEEKSNERDL